MYKNLKYLLLKMYLCLGIYYLNEIILFKICVIMFILFYYVKIVIF